MCGICCIFSSDENEKKLTETLKIIENNVKNRGPDYYDIKITTQHCSKLLFGASVLWLQGNRLVQQPLETDSSLFVYNGDVFESTLITDEEKSIEGDTKLFLHSIENSRGNIMQVLTNIEGPYAFIYLDKHTSKLYFARDVFGRRSLLICIKENQILITSVASRKLDFKCIELPAVGIFCYDLVHKVFEVHPWSHDINICGKIDKLKEVLNCEINIIKSSVSLSKTFFSLPEESDLHWIKAIKNLDNYEAISSLLKMNNWNDNMVKLNKLLVQAVQKRVENQLKYCQNCVLVSNCDHTTIGVLFSGGLDCAILSLLVDKFYCKNKPIDLLNVAFDKVKNYQTPDRITGLQTYEELKCLCPQRQWNFCEVNVTESELNLERKRQIADLIFPLNTVLDDSLGCALWFASKGETRTYQTPCRVLLVGMGADELFGGYIRHKVALERNGWSGLHECLEADWKNLPYRNLSRDDRVTSDHGRQLRTPYLDEKVVNFVRNLKPWEKTCPIPELRQGLGDKLLLRCLAFHLGLRKATFLKKRAIQFGSRIANSKENGNEIAERLLL